MCVLYNGLQLFFDKLYDLIDNSFFGCYYANSKSVKLFFCLATYRTPYSASWAIMDGLWRWCILIMLTTFPHPTEAIMKVCLKFFFFVPPFQCQCRDCANLVIFRTYESSSFNVTIFRMLSQSWKNAPCIHLAKDLSCWHFCWRREI